jgi:hypothetical protein
MQDREYWQVLLVGEFLKISEQLSVFKKAYDLWS